MMGTTGDPGVTALDRGLRLSLRARSGSDGPFLRLVDRALAEALSTGADLPRILHLSVLRARLTGPVTPPSPPYSPAGAVAAGEEHEVYLGELRSRWARHTHRHLYLTPAGMLRALLPPAPLPGNPHSLARLLRTFVILLAPTDRRAATALAALIETPGEAVAADCALVEAAREAHDLDGEAHAWTRQRQLLIRMPSWCWPGHRTEHDSDVLAYLRPDHRARFDAAIGVLPFAADVGSALLTGLPGLDGVYRGAYACHGSHAYTADRLAGRRPVPESARAHDEARRDPAGAGPIVTAVISANEQVLGGAELPVDDPVYRLHARITARTVRARRLSADDLTPEPVSAPLDPERLPAYAEIVRQNADSPIVAALAGRVRADATVHDDREALLILADAGYADPGPLLDGPDEPWPDLSALLFRHRPEEAARRLSAAALADWPVAAAMLEHAAAELLAASGPRVAHALHDAVVRAFTCAAPPGADPPPVVDGAYACRQSPSTES
ncbi:hypothetical protein QLQ12_19165 [Actinoplanes sp. NEAU-A12]|uniref:Uncharacterized protein n=1 Tax=Actinoplanes sandaracinus TaxID=3045177 RepID=A0ABT6WLY1_9ACTN|nr:hypothetical protein [Actinoplanes sandaracinus]MDI6100734.1 hypothetical protein [Actinoplanes sandaracinus]